MKRIFAVLSLSMFFGMVCDVRGVGVVLVSDLDQANIGSFNFGSGTSIAVPFETGSSPISIQQINLEMLQYQQVADEPFAAIYTDNGSLLPGSLLPGATFNPQGTLTSTMGVNAFDPSAPITLQANTTYDLVVSARVLDGFWAWGLVNGAGSAGPGGQVLADASEFRDGSWDTLNPPGTVFGFNLVGTAVPEPSVMSLALVGLGVFVLKKKNRKEGHRI